MQVLRTPDSCFDGVDKVGYPFKPNYVYVNAAPDNCQALRMHYVDEGPKNAEEVVVMLHGEPSWSFLYRKMIKAVRAKGPGIRVIAPDLVGFGKSDKPSDRKDHSYSRHVYWMTQFFTMLDLRNVTLFIQDWGGLIGLRVVTALPSRFSRIVAGNTGLPTGDQPAGNAFMTWREFSQKIPQFPVGGIIKGATAVPLQPEIQAAYDAPFPEEKYKEGPRAMPPLVPITRDDPESAANREAWELLKTWKKPFLCTFSDKDPITKGGDKLLKQLIPGTKNLDHVVIKDGGHFLQEDKGEQLGEILVKFIKEVPVKKSKL